MPEGKGYGPQFTGSVGLNLNYIGNHAYAFSGAINIDNTTATVLQFQLGSEYIVGQVQLGGEIAFMTADKVLGIEILINGVTVINNQFLTVAGGGRTDLMDPIPMLFSPFDNVEVKINTNDTNDRKYQCTITGTVYAKENE